MSATAAEIRFRAIAVHAGRRLLERASRPPTDLHAYQRTPDGDWTIWAIIAGRGAGKTFTGSEWILDRIERGQCKRVALVAATGADARDIMVEGPSGIVTRARTRGIPVEYQPSRRRVAFPTLDAYAFTYSAEEPERLRGPEHEAAWCDELAAWDRNRAVDAWSNLQFGMRIGQHPQTIVTTTPKPVALVRELMKRAQDDDDGAVVMTRGRMVDNRANLAPSAVAELEARYAGTRLGRQELGGELLEDVEGALWTLNLIDQHRKAALPDGVHLEAVVVGVDPAATSSEESAETGIVVCGVGSDRRGYVLGDYSRRGSPVEWARAAVHAYDAHEADRIVPETNQGGEMVIQTIRTVRPGVPIKGVHASRGKATRAEPISALYEQGWISHLDTFPALEDQMTQWVPGEPSPDRMDALVWALTALYPYIGASRGGGLI